MSRYVSTRINLHDRPLPPGAPQRSVLHALSDLAHRYNLAILLTAPLPRGLPSLPTAADILRLPIASLPAAILLLLPAVGDDLPTDPSGIPLPARLMLPIKSPTIAPPPPLSFTLNGTLTWHPCTLTADLAGAPASPHESQLFQHAREFITTTLANGPVDALTILEGADLAVIPSNILQRAKAALRVQSTRDHDYWYWSLPSTTKPPPKISKL